MTFTTTKFAIAAAVLAAGGIAAPAMAGEAPTIEKTRGVKYADLDLSTQEGQDRLRARMNAAARQVCGYSEIQVGTTFPDRHSRQCYKETREGFEREVARATERQENRG